MPLLGFIDCTREELEQRLRRVLAEAIEGDAIHSEADILRVIAKQLIDAIPLVERADERREPAPVNVEITEWPGQAIDVDREVVRAGEGHGWIQWKGTTVCIDVHCRCGCHGHVDDGFFYAYTCPRCGETFVVGQNVRLYPTKIQNLIESAKTSEDYDKIR